MHSNRRAESGWLAECPREPMDQAARDLGMRELSRSELEMRCGFEAEVARALDAPPCPEVRMAERVIDLRPERGRQARSRCGTIQIGRTRTLERPELAERGAPRVGSRSSDPSSGCEPSTVL
jgi:hypothetical protein